MMMMRKRVTMMIGIVMMVLATAGVRGPSRIWVRFDGRATGNGPIGALGVSTGRSRGNPACPRRRRVLDYLHWTTIAFNLDPLESVQAVGVATTTADDRVDAEADLRL